MSLHKSLTGLDIHSIHSFTFANAADRVAGTGYTLTSADVGKIALQSDNTTYWVLQVLSPLTWAELTRVTGNAGVPKDNGNSGSGTVTLDLSLSKIHILTLTGNPTIALSNAKVGMFFLLILKQDATGSRTVTWFTTIKWDGGTAITLTATANKWDSVILYCETAGGSPVFMAWKSGYNF
jgi:hypothetical protein